MTIGSLEIRSVSKRYGGVQALKSVSFKVGKGEIVGLIGANGAGKSTLLNIIGGEEQATSGEIRIGGRPLVGRPHRRARVGLGRTFQHPRVSLDLTVFENVAIGLAVREMATPWRAITLPLRAAFTGRGPSRRHVVEACDMIGLTRLDSSARYLSFGELRLVEVARAVIQAPSVILLDEPFPGIEDDGVAMLIGALKALAASGQTVVLVDHNLSIVQELVQRVVLLARGEVAFDGDTQLCIKSATFCEEYVGGTND